MSETALARPRSMTVLTLRRFTRHRMAVASAVVLVVLCLAALAAPLVEAMLGVDANEVDLLARFEGPSARHPLGADELGRDVLVRLLYGGRVSLFVALVTAVIAAVIGTAVGLVAGYHGGLADAVLMRVTDGVIALPLLPLLIILAAVDLTKLPFLAALGEAENASLYRIVLIIA
ncbi:MAG: ABC transporter permease, partial [Alphaproteobacteria bacterium]